MEYSINNPPPIGAVCNNDKGSYMVLGWEITRRGDLSNIDKKYALSLAEHSVQIVEEEEDENTTGTDMV